MKIQGHNNDRIGKKEHIKHTLGAKHYLSKNVFDLWRPKEDNLGGGLNKKRKFEISNHVRHQQLCDEHRF